jgi:transposase
VRWARRVDPQRLVFVDEAGANIAMGRSHAWVRRGQELVEPRPTNWGSNLTMIGAIRQDQWVTLSTKWRAVTKVTFTVWVRQRLAPRLRPGDIVVLDNLRAHMDPAVRTLVEARGATLRFLPPYSYDFNPIEAAWGLVKKRIRSDAPRTARALRRVAQAARHVVTPHHCQQWFTHAGYVNSSTIRD